MLHMKARKGADLCCSQRCVAVKAINSFEQFCINLCNEKLQKHFVGCVFGSEILNYQVIELNPIQLNGSAVCRAWGSQTDKLI